MKYVYAEQIKADIGIEYPIRPVEKGLCGAPHKAISTARGFIAQNAKVEFKDLKAWKMDLYNGKHSLFIKHNIINSKITGAFFIN